MAILLRSCTTLHPHSGQDKPPMYGDYEAQRHWMEITVNLPIKEWYYNTTDNNLEYWGLDYPPLTAYHSYVCGVIAAFVNKSYVALFESRGIESDAHKFFMRNTVLFVDLLIYIPSIFAYYYVTQNIYNSKTKKTTNTMSTSFAIILALLYPGIILIDHGHFQYNCVSLGFAIFAITCIHANKYVLSSIFFCLALNYKQMELYHALPFFMYLLSVCIPKPGQSSVSGLFRLVKIGVTVILTFGLIWYPFLFSVKDLFQVLHRLFPIARGVFEDKVANFWCALNVFYKLKDMFCNYALLRYCTMVTLTAMLPSLIDLFLRPNVRKFVPALINSSLSFFLFSFQVHEKTILLAAIPVMLYLPNEPVVCFWFLVVSTFSMVPLLIKDELTIAFVALTAFYITSFFLTMQHLSNQNKQKSALYIFYHDFINTAADIQNGKKTYSHLITVISKHFLGNFELLQKLLIYIMIFVSFLGMIILTFSAVCLKPPSHLPDLYPLLISVYSCYHFIGFFLYFNYVQIKIPQSFPIPRIKVKSE